MWIKKIAAWIRHLFGTGVSQQTAQRITIPAQPVSRLNDRPAFSGALVGGRHHPAVARRHRVGYCTQCGDRAMGNSSLCYSCNNE